MKKFGKIDKRDLFMYVSILVLKKSIKKLNKLILILLFSFSSAKATTCQSRELQRTLRSFHPLRKMERIEREIEKLKNEILLPSSFMGNLFGNSNKKKQENLESLKNEKKDLEQAMAIVSARIRGKYLSEENKAKINQSNNRANLRTLEYTGHFELAHIPEAWFEDVIKDEEDIDIIIEVYAYKIDQFPEKNSKAIEAIKKKLVDKHSFLLDKKKKEKTRVILPERKKLMYEMGAAEEDKLDKLDEPEAYHNQRLIQLVHSNSNSNSNVKDEVPIGQEQEQKKPSWWFSWIPGMGTKKNEESKKSMVEKVVDTTLDKTAEWLINPIKTKVKDLSNVIFDTGKFIEYWLAGLVTSGALYHGLKKNPPVNLLVTSSMGATLEGLANIGVSGVMIVGGGYTAYRINDWSAKKKHLDQYKYKYVARILGSAFFTIFAVIFAWETVKWIGKNTKRVLYRIARHFYNKGLDMILHKPSQGTYS